jgi:alpha-L-rhamnosidase
MRLNRFLFQNRPPGAYVFEWAEFRGHGQIGRSGKEGQKIRLRFAERLNPDGTIYTTNLRDARCIDTYICKGSGKEVWQPYFTFHGFQYVELSGVSQKPSLEAITGWLSRAIHRWRGFRVFGSDGQ